MSEEEEKKSSQVLLMIHFAVLAFWWVCRGASSLTEGQGHADGLRGVIVASHQPAEAYKTISKSFGNQHCTVRKIIHKWEAFEGSCQSSKECVYQQIQTEVRLRNSQRNIKRKKETSWASSESLQVYESPWQQQKNKYHKTSKTMSHEQEWTSRARCCCRTWLCTDGREW